MNEIKLKLSNKIVGDSMTGLSTSPMASLQSTYFELVSKIDEFRIGAVFIVEEKKLAGIITDGDLRRAFKMHGPAPLFTTCAKSFFSANPIICHPEMSLYEALLLMEGEKKISCLPVINKSSELIGYVTIHGILSFLISE